jgi:hypothetical protein
MGQSSVVGSYGKGSESLVPIKHRKLLVLLTDYRLLKELVN